MSLKKKLSIHSSALLVSMCCKAYTIWSYKAGIAYMTLLGGWLGCEPF